MLLSGLGVVFTNLHNSLGISNITTKIPVDLWILNKKDLIGPLGKSSKIRARIKLNIIITAMIQWKRLLTEP